MLILFAALDVAIQLGLEVVCSIFTFSLSFLISFQFVLDLGWAIRIGDWLQSDLTKFPNGLSPLIDKAHAAGLKFGLHLPYISLPAFYLALLCFCFRFEMYFSFFFF